MCGWLREILTSISFSKVQTYLSYSISSYGIHPQMSITCRVPATCVKSKEVKKTADSRNEFKVHSVSEDIESVEKIQRRATKLIPELKDMTYTERLKKLKLPSLAHRRRRGDMIQTFKIIKGIEDIPSKRFFKLCTSSSTRGHSLKLEKPRCRTTLRLKQFLQRIIND